VYLHVVFSTKNRVEILTDDIKPTAFNIFKSVAGKNEASIIECNGVCDHMHILIKFKLNTNISEIIKEMKRLPSYCINKRSQYPYFYWQHHYAAFSVSKSNCHKVVNYIRNQQIHHKTKSFHNELEWIAQKCNESIDQNFFE